MKEMSIDSIRVSLMNQQQVVILKVKDGDRALPIWMGPPEADAITLQLRGVDPPRPTTHDVLCDLITTLGIRVEHVSISDLSDDTFYATIVLDYDGRKIEIDSRPSDAIAVALRMHAPINAEEHLIERVGVPMS